MDGNSAAERVWLKATGQPDTERATNGFGSSIFAGAFWCGNGESVTRRSIT